MTETTRRSVVRGAAWTVPVIAIAATAPAFAVSNSCSSILGRWHSSKPALYKVKPTCDSKVKSVTIDGKVAEIYSAPYQAWWYISTRRYTGNRSLWVVITLQNGTRIEQWVNFTPWNNGN